MQVQPYLFFNGRCEEAFDFYKKAVGADTNMLMRYKDSPPPHHHTPEMNDKVLHMQITIGDTTILASDGHCTGELKFEGFALSLTVKEVAEAERLYAALSAGGQATMPLTSTFFSPSFGMLTDKFGVGWMVYVLRAMK